MTTEEFIKEVNQERIEEKKELEDKKTLDFILKRCNGIYNAAVNNGFTNEQAMQYSYGYFYNVMFNK